MSTPSYSTDNGVGCITADGNTKIGLGELGVHIEYDINTTPKIFNITPTGINWTNGVLNFNTELSRIAVIQEAFAAVELPPDSTTLQINKRLLAVDPVIPTTNISIDGSIPSITLTDGTTTNTIDKNGYTTQNSVQNTNHYINFSDSSSSGTAAIKKTTGLSCNPSTNTITATTFIGDLSGNATNIAGGAGGSIPYQTAVNTTALLANGTNGQVLTSQGTTLAPIWSTISLPPPSTSTSLTIGTFVLNTSYFVTYVDSSNAIVGSPVANGFTIYKFAGTATFGTITTNVNVPIEFFVVGGGGGGGGGDTSVSSGGGGGGGGCINGYDYFYTGTTYQVSVGAGGTGGSSVAGSNGTEGTIFASGGWRNAFGGAGGGTGAITALAGGLSTQGGAGGGGSGTGIAGAGGFAYSQQGRNGGIGIAGVPFQAGGGGGAFAVGTSAGVGGSGIKTWILGGTTGDFFGGGGAGGNNTGGTQQGGDGGGGNGGSSSNGSNATADTGGGGGGAGIGISNYTGGNGANGCSIIRIPSFV